MGDFRMWRLFGRSVVVRYPWGWDIRLPFGFWLVLLNAGGAYISDDATPPCRPQRSVESGDTIPGNRGVWLWGRHADV